ncbi:hypothetical protein T07_9912 [Trichinella nelsoni]|uniref:Uncharacterized protein n=1 Tax=Trichinella nelsoni TaxID=6336 RepID=A0A0V0SB09_9BILA|nr:hypothetical protein T07_9912 [Trichinella nelsoni]
MDGKQFLIPLWYNLECTIQCPGSPGCHQSNVGTRRKYQSWRCSGSLGKRFARCLYIVDRTRMKTGKCPDVEGSADAAEASSSYIAGMGFISSALQVPSSPFYMPGARLPGRFQRDLFD